MQVELLDMILAFFEGFALILSPCILAILPVILAGSFTGSKKRPIGIITGFVLTFALLTFFSRKLVQALAIDLNIVRDVSFALLLLLGIIMLSDRLTALFGRLTQRLANVGTETAILNKPQGGFMSGILFGSLVGLIWTPCAGPILAAVIVQTVIQQTTVGSFFTILFFGLGAAVPMLLIAFFGRAVIKKIDFLRNRAILLRKILGVIIILSVAYMLYSTSVAVSFVKPEDAKISFSTQLTEALPNPYPAPAIENVQAWINSPPLELKTLRAKAILIDFWAYSCINCARTIPYLKDWYKKYRDQGLVIIGVHSPEFDFEKDVNNVKNAVKNYGIQYPVVLDNNFTTWVNFNNRYWPAHYLIDAQGNVVYQHFGEGNTAVTENNIRVLLGLNKSAVKSSVEEKVITSQTPETYLGYVRADHFFSEEAVKKDEAQQYSYPKILPKNAWALQGQWIVTPEKIIAAQAGAKLKIHFYAAKVFAVMGTKSNKPIEVKIWLDAAKKKSLKVNHHDLYTLMVLEQPADETLELEAITPGLEIYTFTFG